VKWKSAEEYEQACTREQQRWGREREVEPYTHQPSWRGCLADAIVALIFVVLVGYYLLW